jgi:integrase
MSGRGHIRRRGQHSWELKFDVSGGEGKRVTRYHSFRGTRKEAQNKLAELIASHTEGEYVEPNKTTVGQWIEQWLDSGAPGRRRKKVSQRTLERYGQLLRTHVRPVLGGRPLQQLRAPEIDALYAGLEGKIAPRTAHHVHTVFGASLATAHRKGMIAANPMTRVEQVPNPVGQVSEGDQRVYDDSDDQVDDIGEGLDEAELARLITGFEPSTLYPVVALAAATGARRNELLALRWTDLDAEKKTLRIKRAWEQTKKFGLRVKPPKTKRGLRTIELDDATVAMLLKEKERHQRIAAGIPDSAAGIDLGLVRLPDGALMFPAVPEPGGDFDFTRPRNPRNFSKEFARRSDLLRELARRADLPSFGRTRFHDLRGIHATALLDAGIPVHTVAQRIGDDPAVLLRNYAKRKRTRKADESVAEAIAAISAGFLRT